MRDIWNRKRNVAPRLGFEFLVGVLLSLWATGASFAAPLDLLDPTPRWVEVRFEVSPAEAPGQLDAAWSQSRRAYFEAVPESATIRIRIPAAEIEAHLRSTGTESIPGSFSEFIWTLDPLTGHVVHAAFSGRVRERFTVGFFQASTLVDIRVEMTTQAVGGFRGPRGLFGRRTHAFCSPAPSQADCVAVAPVRFDPLSGYINAVGSLHVATPLARIRTFSPPGEVQFSETNGRTIESAASGTTVADRMVCSGSSDRPCLANLGGES